MGKERLQTRADSPTSDAVEDFADEHDLSHAEAVRKLIRRGLTEYGHELPMADGMGATRDEMNDRMSSIERRQQLQFSASLSVIAGLGWAVVTLTTNASGPLWAIAGLAAMVTLGGINYVMNQQEAADE
jgi:hypothetical protein